MDLTPEEQKTIEYYNNNATKWHETHPGIPAGDLKTFNQYLPKGKVFEIGCGGGLCAAALSGYGYKYIGTDISEPFLNVSRANNPRLTFINQNVYDLDLNGKPYDGFWARASLLHIPRSKIHLALEAIRRNLRQNGIGFIAMKKGRGEQIHRDKDGERFFTYYSRDEFTEILGHLGFEVMQSGVLKVSEKTTWLKFFVKKL
jgi:SAM-dependent methyltransferase